VLRSEKDGNIYIGQTANLDARVRAHNLGKVRSTKSRRPFILEYWEPVNSRKEALELS